MNIAKWLRWKLGGSKHVYVELFGQNQRVRAVQKGRMLTNAEPITFTAPHSTSFTHVIVHDTDGAVHTIPIEGNEP